MCLAYQSGSKADTKPYTNSRPSFRKGVVEEVWENAKGPDGLVRDPNTGEVINWTPGESRKGVWGMGYGIWDTFQKQNIQKCMKHI